MIENNNPKLDESSECGKQESEGNTVSRNLEDYQPGASRALVFDALKKVAKSPKPSPKHGERPAPTSS